MRDCQNRQAEMDEILAVGGSEADFSPALAEHVESCENCRKFCREGLLLNQLMEEPVPLPPVDLVPGVMGRLERHPQSLSGLPGPVERGPRESKLTWAERMAWASSGAVAMFMWERIPVVSLSWLESLQNVLLQVDWTFPVPVSTSASTLVVAALTLMTVQGALAYKTRALIS